MASKSESLSIVSAQKSLPISRSLSTVSEPSAKEKKPLKVTSVSPTNTNKKRKAEVTEVVTELEAKREYNRLSAARARQRQKDLVTDLQEKITDLSDALEKKSRENEVLRAQNTMLTKQNDHLLNAQAANNPAASATLPRAVKPAFDQRNTSTSNLSASGQAGNTSAPQGFINASSANNNVQIGPQAIASLLNSNPAAMFMLMQGLQQQQQQQQR